MQSRRNLCAHPGAYSGVGTMAEIITCPACARKLQVPESFYGQTVQCPECAHQFVADPHASSVQTAPSPIAPASPPSSPQEDDRPRRRKPDHDDDFDDDFDDMRPLRRSGVPHRGGTILALGIISLVIFPYATVVCGPLAWIMGNTDLAEIRAGRMDSSGEGMVQAGRVLGMISTILILGAILFLCLFVGLIVMTGRG
jgi:hypothetical protein